MGGLAASVEVTRSAATTASTLAGAGAAVAFAGLGALAVVALTAGGDDTRSRRTMLIATTFVIVATTVEFSAYLIEQVSLTAEAVTAVATSTRSVVVVARLLAVGALVLLLHGRRVVDRHEPGAWRALRLVAALAALATAMLDPVGGAAWRSLVALGLGAAGAVVVLRVHAVGPVLAAVTTSFVAVSAATIVVLGGVSDGWSARLPTEAGTFDVSILPAEPGRTNEVHVIGQPGADGTPPTLQAVTMSGRAVRGPDTDLAPGSPFELFLLSTDHAIGYGIELVGTDPWLIDVEFRTVDANVHVELEVERP